MNENANKSSAIVRDKWVLIEAEFDAEGVWTKSGCACQACDLPVSEDLVQRILEWQRRYDYETPPPFDREGYVWGSFDAEDFSRQGSEIAQTVKAQLPDWTVIYFDLEKFYVAHRLGQQQDKSTFVYEVSLLASDETNLGVR